MIEIIVAEGSSPRTRNVEMATAATHIAARDRLAAEAEILLAYSESEDCQRRDPVGYLWGDEIDDARFLFEADELHDLDRHGSAVVRLRIIDQVAT